MEGKFGERSADLVSVTENEKAMAWLDSSLQYAREHEYARLEELLDSVLTEVLLDIELARRLRQPARRG